MSTEKQICIDLEVHIKIEQNRASFEESQNAILRRLLGLDSPEEQSGAIIPISHNPKLPKGKWSNLIDGHTDSFGSMLEAYKDALKKLSVKHPDFLDKFSLKGTWARKFVAKDPSKLYLNTPTLVQYAYELCDDWYFDSNVSEQQVRSRIDTAAEILGLTYGQDIAIFEGDRLI